MTHLCKDSGSAAQQFSSLSPHSCKVVAFAPCTLYPQDNRKEREEREGEERQGEKETGWDDSSLQGFS